jgi:hypothetical protein
MALGTSQSFDKSYGPAKKKISIVQHLNLDNGITPPKVIEFKKANEPEYLPVQSALRHDENQSAYGRPMKSIIRGIRRHHLQRLKKARAFDHAIGKGRQGDTAALGRHVNTPAKCSCWMCGNPRRYFDEKSRQERIHDEKFDADLAMIGPVRFEEISL